MALKFWLGGARSDRTRRLYKYILEEAQLHPDRQYLIIVPEQSNLSTQREFVELSERHGILNIDVLSFSRLAHRIGDEVGSISTTVTTLDDMGKNLILQLVAQRNKEKLRVFGDSINKIGYVSNIKSLVSEFMQYGVSAEKVDELSKTAGEKGKILLEGKLSDVSYLYREFLSYIKDKYTTTEETLISIADIVPKSDTLKNSVVVFDNYTGFTPIQLKLISAIMDYAKDVHVGLVCEKGPNDNSDRENQEVKVHDLFYLSKKTINQLGKLADEKNISVSEEYVSDSILKNQPDKQLYVAVNPEEEMKSVVVNIRKLVSDKGYRYRDIAVIAGDLEGYRNVIERVFTRAQIPYFIDKTQPILLNPFVEYVRSLIAVFENNYSYESVFGFLKSGLTSYDEEMIDILDNYCLATGIKGYKRWHERFIRTTTEVSAERILEIEQLRQQITEQLDSFVRDATGMEESARITASSKIKVRDFSEALYNMVIGDDIENKLRAMAEAFEEEGNRALAQEYKQIYSRIMDVLDELVELIPDEPVDVRQFGELLQAGFDEIRIGVAPKFSDYVQIGDITRSRFSKIKALFIVGANDGNIPRVSNKSGIINESDREFLIKENHELTLAPTAREDAYTQRLYIYTAMNKPEDNLYISYASMSASGQSLMPSYIIRSLRKEDPSLKINSIEGNSAEELGSKEDAFSKMLELAGQSKDRSLEDSNRKFLENLMLYFVNNDEYRDRTVHIIDKCIASQETSQKNTEIGAAVANALYGKSLYGSVSRLETYANCAYQFFLQYGLGLKERELFSFEARDMGNIFHNSLSEFGKIMEKKKINWFTISEEQAEAVMDEAVNTVIARDNMASLYSTARTSYMVNRIKRIMRRTASVVTGQVKAGEFIPKYFEVDFEDMDCLDSIEFTLPDSEKMKLNGRIDRVDICEKDGRLYVKVIDYKSSAKSLNLIAIYEGKQLQLLTYLNAAIEHEEKKLAKSKDTRTEVLPAGVLYYHIDDPVLNGGQDKSDDEIRREIAEKLKLSGYINGDENGRAIDLMDMHLEPETKSTVVNVSRIKNGTLGKSGDAISGEEFEILRGYVKNKIKSLGEDILRGNIAVPVVDGEKVITGPDCTYCSYKSICAQKSTLAEEGEQTEGNDAQSAITIDKNNVMECMKTGSSI